MENEMRSPIIEMYYEYENIILISLVLIGAVIVLYNKGVSENSIFYLIPLFTILVYRMVRKYILYPI